MDSAQSAWDALDPVWHRALDEAWASWSAGSAGVGAVLVDGGGSIMASGRNRTAEHSASHLSATMMAHAEMDVLSQVPFGTRINGTLYTTFEPCLMCAATIAFYRVPEVHYAAADPYFDGLHDWFAGHPVLAGRAPDRTCIGGPIGSFCHVLHLAWLVAFPAPPEVIDAHRRLAPRVLGCADTLVDDARLRGLGGDGASVVEALAHLWPRLVALQDVSLD